MNKKIMLIGSLALILAMGLVFIGCNQDAEDEEVPDEVRIVNLGSFLNKTADVISAQRLQAGFDQQPPIPPTTVNNTYVIRWQAPSDAREYHLVFKQTGPVAKETPTLLTLDSTMLLVPPLNYLTIAPTNNDPFHDATDPVTDGDPYGGGAANTTDVDAWTAVVALDAILLKGASRGQIGVMVIPLTQQDKNSTIYWFDEVRVTQNAPQP